MLSLHFSFLHFLSPWHIWLFNLKMESRWSYLSDTRAAVIRNSILVLVWVKSVDNWYFVAFTPCMTQSHPLSFVGVFFFCFLGVEERG